MKENFSEVVFSVPYEMAAVRPLRQTSRQERQAALQAACYNTELIPQELVYVDLKTDSGVSIDAEGWFHTGDCGMIDDEDCLFIVGRKKDIFNCSDGSNIYPAHIELLLENGRFIRQAILLGDQRPFIAALIVPNKKLIAAELKKAESALSDGEIEALIRSRLEEINRSLEAYERVRKFGIMPSDFPPEVRSVSVFEKIKIERKAVQERYEKIISAIYSTASEGGSV